MKNVLNTVRLATTKGQTELAGSHTFYFDEKEVFAYNNLYGIKADNIYPIQGSVNADKFFQFIKRIQDEQVQDTGETLVIKYGKNKATFRKEKDGLKLYKGMVFSDNYDKKELPEDFTEMLSLIKYQNHRGSLGGLFVDDDTAYVVNTNDLASFTLSEKYGRTFWMPREGVDMLLGLPLTFTHYAITGSFFYVFADGLTVAIKLKMPSGFPLSSVEALLQNNNDFSKYIIVDNMMDTLNRIKISTIQDANQKNIFSIQMKEKEVVVESMGTDKIEEHLECTNKTEQALKIVVPIDTFQTLYSKAGKIYIINGKDNLFLAHHTNTVTYIMRVESL
jgi:hypothetical protein